MNIGIQDIGETSFTFTKLPVSTTKVGKYVSIAEGCFFHEDEHYCHFNKKFVSSYIFNQDRIATDFIKDTIIGNDVYIGHGAMILYNINIGDGAIIGAGAVVVKDVPPYAVVAGNPAVIKRYRYSPRIIKKLLKIKWWDWDPRIIEERKADFEDVDAFVEKYG